MRPNDANRTPFDDALVDDPNAPRQTQPLPSSGLHSAGARRQPIAGTGRTLPPQVLTNAPSQADDEDDDFTGYSAGPRARRGVWRGLPTTTLVGAAMAFGAVAVILLSTIISRSIPRPNSPLLRPQDAPAPNAVTPGSDVIMEPRTESEPPGESLVASSAPVDAENRGESSSRTHSDQPGKSRSSEQTRTERRAEGENRDAARGDEDTVRRRTEKEREEAVREEEQSRERTEVERPRGGRTGDRRSSDGRRFVHNRSGYSIAPPPDFKLRQSGRRTIWRGPDGAQLLVETARVGDRSPRADWEHLDSAFRKKYGRRYRSLGIRETTLAGRPAAVWEFEIDGKKGTTRKVDVAVHHHGTGYAVLGSAPTSRFEDLRPQIEDAIRSFELPSDDDRASHDRGEPENRDPESTGY